LPLDRSAVEFINKDFTPTTVPEVLAVYQDEIINALKTNLEEAHRVSTGTLTQSIRVDVEQDEDVVSFTLFMEDYWRFVDEGRAKGGKQPPIDAMLDFIKFRGIVPKQPRRKSLKPKKKSLSMDKRRKSLAFAMAKSIKEKGIKPTNFFSDVVNDNLKKRLTNDISKALAKDIRIEFQLTNEALNG